MRRWGPNCERPSIIVRSRMPASSAGRFSMRGVMLGDVGVSVALDSLTTDYIAQHKQTCRTRSLQSEKKPTRNVPTRHRRPPAARDGHEPSAAPDFAGRPELSYEWVCSRTNRSKSAHPNRASKSAAASSGWSAVVGAAFRECTHTNIHTLVFCMSVCV